jgi:hypothetical protein
MLCTSAWPVNGHNRDALESAQAYYEG